MKSGIFAKNALLEGESRAEYGSLLNGLREDLQPRGTLEAALVENLAVLLWRKRRLLRAETAEILSATEFKTLDSVLAQVREAWDYSRAGETSGGMLRHNSNPFVIHEAIKELTRFRDRLEESGFPKGSTPWVLRKLYGLDHDGKVPMGIMHAYLTRQICATDIPEVTKIPDAPDKLKNEMVAMFDEEINRLKSLELSLLDVDKQRGKYQTIAALVPPQDVLERLVRYEAHLTRESERTLNQLERLQRIRLGQPVPPSMRLEISR